MTQLSPDSRLSRGSYIDPGQIASLIGADAWRLTPATFAMRISQGSWIPARHLLWASARIAAAVQKGNARLLVQWPPRHGKSEMLSVYTPVWFLDQFPHKKVIMISYGADLVEEFAGRVRDLILDHHDTGLLNVKLKKDKLRINNFETTASGHVYAVGMGGTLTGRGAHLMMIDDYLKNAKDASSKQIRDDDYDWFRAVANTRMEPGGSIIIFAARWDVDDLAGRLEKEQGDIWEIIRLPAIADSPDDPLGRKIGEALWPERIPLEELLVLKRALGDYFFSALYQQRPKKKAAGLTRDRITIVDVLPHYSRLRMVRVWDLAATEGGGDWTTGTLLAEDALTGITYICDIQRKQIGPHETERLVLETAKQDGLEVPVLIEQEPGSAGKTLLFNYQKRVLKGFAVKAALATTKKWVRAQPFMAQVEAGTVYMLRGPWNRDFLDELEQYPDGDFDDQIDTCANGYNYLNSKNTGGAVWGRRGSGLIVPDSYTNKAEPGSNDYTPPAGFKKPLLGTGATWGRRRV